MAEPMPETPKKLGTLRAIFVGQLIVNIPALAIMLASIILGLNLVPAHWFYFAAGGFIVAWGYWAFMVGRWHKWAIRRGVDQRQLSRLAIMTGLMWSAQLMPSQSDLDDEEEEEDE
jgi:hypothetical protein